ncbi:MAG: phage tail family protein, partial [Oscillospiraceae bacterium]
SLDRNSNFRLVEDLELNSGDTLVINTNKGEKSVTKIDSDGNISNCINYVDTNSVWLTLETGQHDISKVINFGYEHLVIEVEFYNLYIGL